MKEELAVLPVGHGGAGLEALVAHVGCNKGLVQNERGVLEARVDVAKGPLVRRMAHG